MAKESKGLLSGGLFAKPIMNSRVKTRAVSKKEKFLGHLLGPLGLIFVVNTIAALVEKFFTQQVGAMYGTGNVEMIQKMGGYYEAIMTVTKVLGVRLGTFNRFLAITDKIKTGTFPSVVFDFRLYVHYSRRIDIPIPRHNARRELLVLFLLYAYLLQYGRQFIFLHVQR